MVGLQIFNKSCVIYMAKFPNGKMYIGQTKRTFKERYMGHVYTLNRTDVDLPFYRAIRKYGLENVSWSILEHVKDALLLNDREIYWIDKYNTYIRSENSKGYNATIGGNNFPILNTPKLKPSEVFYIEELFKNGKSIVDISKITSISSYAIFNIVSNKKISYLTKEQVEKIKYMLTDREYSAEKIAMKFNCSANKVHEIKCLITHADILPELNGRIKEVFEENKKTAKGKTDINTVMNIKIDLSLGYSTTESAVRNGVSFYCAKDIFTFKRYSDVLGHLNSSINKFKVIIRKINHRT